MEAIVVMVVAGLLGSLVTMGVMGMVQEIMKHNKGRVLKDKKDKEKQI